MVGNSVSSLLHFMHTEKIHFYVIWTGLVKKNIAYDSWVKGEDDDEKKNRRMGKIIYSPWLIDFACYFFDLLRGVCHVDDFLFKTVEMTAAKNDDRREITISNETIEYNLFLHFFP